MKIIVILGCVILSVASQTCAAKITIRHNDVIFVNEQKSDDGAAAALFLVDRHSVTPQQPSTINDQAFLPHWFKHFYDGNYSKTVFRINAGRHKSGEVYNALTQWRLITSGVPKEMNFAVMGTLGFTLSSGHAYVCKDVALAQTSLGLRHQWYIFSLNGSGIFYGTRYTDVTCINTASKLLRSFRIFSHKSNLFVIKAEGPEIT